MAPNTVSKPFRFDLLPQELQGAVVNSLGSEFFRKDIKRLTVSKKWYTWALATMYRNFDASTILYPFAPFNTCGVYWNQKEPEKQFPCGWSACPEFRSVIQDNIARHLLSLRVDVDASIQNVGIPVGYKAGPDWNDVILKWRATKQPPRDQRRHFHGERIHGEAWTHFDAMDWPAHSVQLLTQAPKAQELEVILREPWCQYRFNGELDVALFRALQEPSKLSVLRLDLAGLGMRTSHTDRFENLDVHGEANLPYVEDITSDDQFANPFDGFHLCNAVCAKLLNLSALHYRAPSVCSCLFRHKSSSSPLPKLKEVIINLAMPNRDFFHQRVCHCSTEDLKLSPESLQHMGDQTVELMKTELCRLLERMEKPKMVRLRYPRRLPGPAVIDSKVVDRTWPNGIVVNLRTTGRIVVDTDFVDEWDALTGKVRQRRINEYGEVIDCE